MSFSADYNVYSVPAPHDVKCYVYNETLPSVMPLLGNLTGVIDTFPFVGYIVAGQEPTLCPLYCSPMGLELVQQHIKFFAYLETGRAHAPALEAESTEVPLYTIERHVAPALLDLPPKWTRQGHDRKIHVVFDGVANSANFRTIIHWADFPLGYNMPDFSFDHILEISDVYSTMSVNDHSLFNGWLVSDVDMGSEDDGSFSAYANHEAPYPAHSAPHPAPAAPYVPIVEAQDSTDAPHQHTEAQGLTDAPLPHAAVQGSTDAPLPHTAAQGSTGVPARRTNTLKGIMTEYPKWRLVLAYMRLLIRVAICTGNSGNPHEITTNNADVRAVFMADIFAQSLQGANTAEEQLETIISSEDGSTITRNMILLMAGKWVSQFIYDTARVADDALYHRQAGFGLDDIFGPVLQARLGMLLENFLHPKSVCLPIDQNGLVWFFRSKFSKALVWHIVFRKTRSNGVRIHSTPNVPLVLADLAPDVFRNAPHLPIDTLAFAVSFCYSALLRKLDAAVTNNAGSSYDRNHYPSPTTVHNDAVETLKILLQLEGDSGHPEFMAIMLLFCNLTVRNIVRVVRPPKK
ncbi:hypothetical protein EV702DRAFT_1204781 [Suillus placidus]|uniref:Uncharacterized protein n=1 Tax=Suillus placidus TaxID=48579 RepID=A0A9P7CW94_9AGAM|nr:hypothetical protein EV702DRAFT_1204781 [Suillus placidus]